MKGSIRAFVGFMLAFGAVGAIETGDALLVPVLVAVVGLATMASGVNALKVNAA